MPKKKKYRAGSIIYDSWSIDWAFAKWVLPRLIALRSRDIVVRSPEWERDVDFMIAAFSFNEANTKKVYSPKEMLAQQRREIKALKLFTKHFYSLWD